MQRNEEKSSQNNTALITRTTSTGPQTTQRNRRKQPLKKRIPVISDEQKQQLFNGDLTHFQYSYIYDCKRVERHYAAQLVIYDLLLSSENNKAFALAKKG
jgi:hypothetical protein